MKNKYGAAFAGILLCSAGAAGMAGTSATLTLTTYNIHSAIPDGKNGANYWPRVSDLHNVADVLTTAGSEIVALQEVRNLWANPRAAESDKYPIDMPLYLSGLLDMHYAFGGTMQYIVPGLPPSVRNSNLKENREYLEWGNWNQWTNNGARHGEFGNAILSRFAMKAPPEILKLPRGTDERALKLGDEPRLALRAELKEQISGLGRVVLYCTHFQHNNEETRRQQIRALLDRAAKDLAPENADASSTITVFLMGDFNHHRLQGNDPFLDAVDQAGFHDIIADHAKENGEEPAGTIMHQGKPIRIDYIFCSRPVEVEKVLVQDTSVSDHKPVTVTIKTGR